MDDKNSPALIHGDPARVLGVTELLENVLCNLSPGDVLKNAQAVSKFWRDCVEGSTAVKKKCFLVADNMSEGDTDSRLFLGAGLPDLSKSLAGEWQQWGHTADLGQLTVVTPTTLRTFLAENSFTRRDQYKWGIQEYFQRLDDNKENMRLASNMGGGDTELDTRNYESLLNMSLANPLLRRSWKGKGSAVFTGHEKHLIFALGDNYSQGCDYFTHTRTFLETIAHAMRTNQSRQVWKSVQITSPAVKELTVNIWFPGGAEVPNAYLHESGITMLDFANMFIMTVREALRSYDSVHVEHWLGEIHGYHKDDGIWKRSMHTYEKERYLIEMLVERLESMEGIW